MADEDGFPAGGDGPQWPGKDGHVIHQGYLQKKSPKGFFKVWQDRYFILYNEGFAYFKSQKEVTQPLGFVAINTISSINCDPALFKTKGFRFDILVGEKGQGREFSMVAKTEAEVMLWVKNFRKCVEYWQDNQGHYTDESKERAAVTRDGKQWKVNAVAAKSPGTDNTQDAHAGRVVTTMRKSSVDLQGPGPLMPIKVKTVKHLDLSIIKQVYKNKYGSYYVLGDQHYNNNRKSYICHVIEKDSTYFTEVTKCFEDMATLDHRFILKQVIRGSCADSAFAIYTPPVRRTQDNLLSWILREKRLDEDALRDIGFRLTYVLFYIHSQKSVFVNLCPETIYVDNSGNIVVVDFLLKLDTFDTSLCVPEYAPPEGHDSKQIVSDWWRMGVLLYELCTGMPPYRSADALAKVKARKPEPLIFPATMSSELKDLLSKLLIVDTSQRLGGNEEGGFKFVLTHPFFAPLLKVASTFNHRIQTEEEKKRKLEFWDVVEKSSFLTNAASALAIHDETPTNMRALEREDDHYSLEVNLLDTRNFPKEFFARLYASVSVDGEIHKSKVINASDFGATNPSETPAGSQTKTTMGWNENFVFEMNASGACAETMDLVIHLISKSRESEGQSGLVGSFSMPVATVKQAHPSELDLWVHILPPDGINATGNMMWGELHITLKWKKEKIELQMGPTFDAEHAFDDAFTLSLGQMDDSANPIKGSRSGSESAERRSRGNSVSDNGLAGMTGTTTTTTPSIHSKSSPSTATMGAASPPSLILSNSLSSGAIAAQCASKAPSKADGDRPSPLSPISTNSTSSTVPPPPSVPSTPSAGVPSPPDMDASSLALSTRGHVAGKSSIFAMPPPLSASSPSSTSSSTSSATSSGDLASIISQRAKEREARASQLHDANAVDAVASAAPTSPPSAAPAPVAVTQAMQNNAIQAAAAALAAKRARSGSIQMLEKKGADPPSTPAPLAPLHSIFATKLASSRLIVAKQATGGAAPPPPPGPRRESNVVIPGVSSPPPPPPTRPPTTVLPPPPPPPTPLPPK